MLPVTCFFREETAPPVAGNVCVIKFLVQCRLPIPRRNLKLSVRMPHNDTDILPAGLQVLPAVRTVIVIWSAY
jgi:hypothetical protein